MSDRLNQQTILDFQNGEEKAFESIYKGYYTSIVAFLCNKMSIDQHEAKDIANELFRALFQGNYRFENEISLRSFLFKSARNRCLNYLIAKKRRTARDEQFIASLPDDTLLAYEYSIKEEVLEAIHQAIENMPEERRKVFKLLYLEGLKPAEVAELLQVDVNTVYSHKSHGMKALRLKFLQSPLIITWLMMVLGSC